MSKRTYNKTCETCGEGYAARGCNQRECDDCWGAEMGAVRVEYRAKGGQNVRTAIVVCRECAVEYPTRPKVEKHPGLCNRCSGKNLDKTFSKVCDTCDLAFVALSPRTRMCDECWGEMMGAVRVERQRRKNGVLSRTAIVVCRECQREYSTRKENRQNRDLCRSCMTYSKTCETCGEKWQAQGGKQRECDDCWAAAVGAVRVEYRANSQGANVRTAIMVCRECDVEYSPRRLDQRHPGLCKDCTYEAPERSARIGAQHRGKTISPDARAKLREANLGKKQTAATIAERRKALIGKKRTPDQLANLRAAKRELKRRGMAQGGKFGRLYLVAGVGQAKFGGSMSDKTLKKRLRDHADNQLDEVIDILEIDPALGGKAEAAVLKAMFAKWEMVGTTVRPDGGNETVWCDDPEAVLALVEEVLAPFGARSLRAPEQMAA